MAKTQVKTRITTEAVICFYGSGVVFGAACTLSHMGTVLKQKVAALPPHQTEVFLAVLEQLRWFGGLQVRNVAVSPKRHISVHETTLVLYELMFLCFQAVGGNIMTASPISDLNPVFMAAGCKLTLMDKGNTRTHVSYSRSQSTDQWTTEHEHMLDFNVTWLILSENYIILYYWMLLIRCVYCLYVCQVLKNVCVALEITDGNMAENMKKKKSAVARKCWKYPTSSVFADSKNL